MKRFGVTSFCWVQTKLSDFGFGFIQYFVAGCGSFYPSVRLDCVMVGDWSWFRSFSSQIPLSFHQCPPKFIIHTLPETNSSPSENP